MPSPPSWSTVAALLQTPGTARFPCARQERHDTCQPPGRTPSSRRSARGTHHRQGSSCPPGAAEEHLHRDVQVRTAEVSIVASGGSVGAVDDPVVDVIGRLTAEFEDRVELATISRVVLGCRADLDCSPVAALPELILRLARQRLLDSGPGPAIPRAGARTATDPTSGPLDRASACAPSQVSSR